MEELPQTPAPVAPAQPQAAYEPKHWHWPLWGGLFVASIFIGGVVYVYFQTPPTEGPASSSQLVDNHFLNQKGEKSNYILKGVQIYFVLSSYPTVTEILAEGTDPTSFRVLCEAFSDISAYAKDAGHVYFRGHILEDADSQTFQPLYNADGSCYDYYAKDSRHVYYAQEIISDSPDSFVVLSPDEELFSDGINTFQWGEIVSTTTSQEKANTGSLQALDEIFSTDGIHIYALYSEILDTENDGSFLEGIDAKTFKLHCIVPQSDSGVDYACDANHLINRGLGVVVVGDYDLQTLERYPNSDYFKDKNYVYHIYHANFMGRLDEVDSATFAPVSAQPTYDAQDKNHKYLQGEIVQ